MYGPAQPCLAFSTHCHPFPSLHFLCIPSRSFLIPAHQFSSLPVLAPSCPSLPMAHRTAIVSSLPIPAMARPCHALTPLSLPTWCQAQGTAYRKAKHVRISIVVSCSQQQAGRGSSNQSPARIVRTNQGPGKILFGQSCSASVCAANQSTLIVLSQSQCASSPSQIFLANHSVT